MESKFIAKCVLTLENDGNKKTSKVVSVDINLDSSENIFFDKIWYKKNFTGKIIQWTQKKY